MSSLLSLDDDLHHHERGATQLEEVISSTHLVHLQDARKDVAEAALKVVGRRLVGRADGQHGLWQRFDIGLAVGCHRHLLQLQVGRRHHILRQASCYLFLEVLWRYLAVGSIVGTEVLAVVQLAYHDDHLLHALHLEHHVLYLAELNAQAAQLDLMVGTSQDEHIAVGQPLGIVAALVDTHIVIVDEALARHVVEVVIATRHTASADIEFAHHADGQFVAVGIDDKLLDVQLRTSHCDHFGMRQFGIVRRHRNLRRTVAVEDACLCDAAHLGQQGLAELLAAGTTDFEMGYALAEYRTREPRLPS